MHLLVHGLVRKFGPHRSNALGRFRHGKLGFLNETFDLSLIEEHVGALGAFRLRSLTVRAQINRLLLSS